MGRKASGGPHAPACIDNRYDVIAEIGRGGMAAAFRVRDKTTGTDLALKRLVIAPDANGVGELFEREFHTLTQLAHPRVVRAFDYGLDDGQPYYTMELLDGGDLRELAPMPWQEVCAVAYDICSALSLIHSRRLLHRDLTPRNIRRTSEGAAKLIDFGLLASFGPGNVMAGTPPYVAPELVNKVSMDARSDLFSLGATLYYALTGRTAFGVSRFDQLRDAWRSAPASPRKLVPEIPEAIDKLVMALLRIDAASRPKSAAEVMERLAPWLAEPPDDTLAIAGAYLTAPQQVGRDKMVTRMRKQMLRAVRGRGGGFLIAGDPGTGRSRAVDAFVLEAKLLGAATARAGASDGAHGDLGVVNSLVAQIHQAAQPTSIAVAEHDPRVWSLLFGDAPKGPSPALVSVSRPGLDRAEAQQVLRQWLLGVASKRLVALAVDDLELADEPSASWLATLALEASDHRLTYAVSAQKEALGRSGTALAVLRDRSKRIDLEPLSETEVLELLSGVFGDVPHLEGLSRQLFRLSNGRPRECMTLAQHLVDDRVISYRAGRFWVPANIDPSALPADLEEAARAQVESLPQTAKRIGQLLSLSAIERLTRAQLMVADRMTGSVVDTGIEALVRIQAVVGTPHGYRISNPALKRLLVESLDTTDLPAMHDQLAAIYRSDGGAGLAAVSFHRLRGARPEQALDDLLAASESAEARTAVAMQGYKQIGIEAVAETMARALEVAIQEDRPVHQRYRIWPYLAGISASGADIRYYDMVVEPWLAALKVASGYNDWLELDHEPDPAARAMQAFIQAAKRHEETPEDQQIAPPADAIKELVAYVVFSIAVASRSRNDALASSLPGLLEPFSPLNPVVNAMRLNAEATLRLTRGQREKGRARCIELIGAIDAIEGERLAFMDRVRAAVCQAIATQEAALGIEKDDPDEWLRSNDPNQLVGAEYIKKIMALHRGDWDLAETHCRRAEVIALQNDASSMFSTLWEELEAHAMARDLTGLRQVRARLHESVNGTPHWQAMVEMADAFYHYLCGEQDQAMALVERVRGSVSPTHRVGRLLPLMECVAVEILLERDDPQTALSVGLQALQACERDGLRHLCRILSAPVALAEARVGRYEEAKLRLTRVIEAQRELSISGLLLGRSHEYMARCALSVGDLATFVSASQEAALQYRPGQSHVLGALHERLLEEARRVGAIGEAMHPARGTEEHSALSTHVSETFMDCHDDKARATAALTLLQEAAGASSAYLFLLGEGGLSLSACAGERAPSVEPLFAFAQMQIELEQDDEVCTMTAQLDELDNGAEAAAPVDGSGQPYQPVSLLVESDSELVVLGVALLSARSTEGPLGPVATEVAKHLLKSGDYRPVVAA